MCGVCEIETLAAEVGYYRMTGIPIRSPRFASASLFDTLDLMRSPTQLPGKPLRSFSGVASHNRALRIMRERAHDTQE